MPIAAITPSPGDVVVIEDPTVAGCVLDPLRARILATLVEPGSSTTVASTLGLPRQQVNYHLRVLESHGLVGLVEERPRRGLTERIVRATAASYVVSPSVLGELAADPARVDRLSARYVVALAARTLRDISVLTRAASAAGKRLPTLAIDTDIRFASAADRSAFTDELAAAVVGLTAKYHDERAPQGRWHRLVVNAYPRPHEEQPT